MSDKGPLSGRGNAEEERWAREQDRAAIEKMKQKDGDKGCGCKDGKKDGDKGCGCKDGKKSGTCGDHATTDPKDCCKKNNKK
jgi:hypothetical protein